MPVKQAKGTVCPDPLILDTVTLEWFARRYPQVDPEIATERYMAWSIAGGYLYNNHFRALQNYVIREADANRLGPMLKRSQPKTDERAEWERLKSVQARIGADPPNGRTLEQYKAYLEAYARPPNVADLFKRVAK